MSCVDCFRGHCDQTPALVVVRTLVILAYPTLIRQIDGLCLCFRWELPSIWPSNVGLFNDPGKDCVDNFFELFDCSTISALLTRVHGAGLVN